MPVQSEKGLFRAEVGPVSSHAPSVRCYIIGAIAIHVCAHVGTYSYNGRDLLRRSGYTRNHAGRGDRGEIIEG